MSSFKDMKCREWHIEPTIGAVKRAKSLAGVDLLDLKANPFLRFAEDPIALVDCLFALVKPQADAAGVTDVEFGESLGGETLGDAVKAFEDAYALFFHRPEDRKNATLILQRTNQALAVAGEKIHARIGSIDVAKVIDAEMAKLTGGASSGDAPASAA